MYASDSDKVPPMMEEIIKKHGNYGIAGGEAIIAELKQELDTYYTPVNWFQYYFISVVWRRCTICCVQIQQPARQTQRIRWVEEECLRLQRRLRLGSQKPLLHASATDPLEGLREEGRSRSLQLSRLHLKNPLVHRRSSSAWHVLVRLPIWRPNHRRLVYYGTVCQD